MVSKKRKSKRQSSSSRGRYLLLLLLIAVCLGYEPAAHYLSEHYGIELPLPAETPATVELPADAHPELPAPLADRPERILVRRGYTVSFNREWNLPNWVAWELNTDKLVERESRSDNFQPDPDLPASEAVTTNDYKGAGMDRGHMCPAGDNRWHWKAMLESFYMTNICPQNHNLNRGDWKELEEACRRWAKEWGSIYVACGPIVYSDRKQRTIGKEHRIVVPDAFFKVVLCTACRPPKAIGFVYKNESGSRPMESYVTTVDEVERITGIDFFTALPDEVERVVEAQSDWGLWEKQ